MDKEKEPMTKVSSARTAYFMLALFAALFFACPIASSASDLDSYIMPVSNPVYLGDARNLTMIRPIYIYQNLPEKVSTTIGKVPVDGHLEVFALQASYAFSDRFSFVAVKDGYVDCEPDQTINAHSGWADIAAGFQYSFLYQPENQFVLTGRLVYELPSGSDQVYQANGDGNIAPSILFLKGFGPVQFSGTLGLVIPVDNDEENTLFYDSWHLSYNVSSWFRPLVELNHFYVIDSGDRDKWIREKIADEGIAQTINDTIGTGREDDIVATIADFNGSQLVNLGGTHNDENRNFVTLAIGARFPVTDWLSFGAVYEFSLTDDENGLLDDGLVLDAVITLRF